MSSAIDPLLADDAPRSELLVGQGDYDPRHAFDLIPGLFATMRPDGAIEFANRELREFLGQSLQELRAWRTNGTVLPSALSTPSRTLQNSK